MRSQRANYSHQTLELDSPGGGAARAMGGGAPRPGGYCVGAPAMLAPAAAAATVPLPCGPPTPRTGPASPAGRSQVRGQRSPSHGGTQQDALTSLGGGPSTVMETRFSPRSRTRPRTRFSSRSGCFEFFGLQERTGSESHRMRFMCLSKALKVPMKMRPSCRMHLILKSMCCSILLLFPTVCNQSETSSSMTSPGSDPVTCISVSGDGKCFSDPIEPAEL
uniref:Uncharacterized protein n=1 Tax=Poecilia reticulata TaxID=8081 RepID=A0A3P9PMH7_POERE